MATRIPERRFGDLSGRVAVVTGASSGIGLACVREFLRAGATVHGVARRADAIREQLAEPLSGTLHTHELDVTDRQAVGEWAASLADEPDLLVASAGTNVTDRRISELTPEGWDTVVRTNLDAVYTSVTALLPGILRRQGDVILIASLAAMWPDHTGAAYQASKAGVVAFGRALAHDVHQDGVRVTTISPGIVDTPILDRRPVPPPAQLRKLFMKPEDIAQMALVAATMPQRVSLPEITMMPTYVSSIGFAQNPNDDVDTARWEV